MCCEAGDSVVSSLLANFVTASFMASLVFLACGGRYAHRGGGHSMSEKRRVAVTPAWSEQTVFPLRSVVASYIWSKVRTSVRAGMFIIRSGET